MPMVLVAASRRVFSTLLCSALVRGRIMFSKDCGNPGVSMPDFHVGAQMLPIVSLCIYLSVVLQDNVNWLARWRQTPSRRTQQGCFPLVDFLGIVARTVVFCNIR